MHAVGWNIESIRGFVADETGRLPAWSTVARWVDPAFAETARRRDRDRKRRNLAAEHGGRLRSNFHTVEARIARIKTLGAAGLSNEAISKVMGVDFPDVPLTRHQIDGILRGNRMPRALKRAAA